MRHPEHQYLEMLARVLESGDSRTDRTGVGTLSRFGEVARFDLSSGEVPILTTKRVYWKTAVKEMLWFLTGETNIRDLLREKVRIWTDWPLEKYRKATGTQISQADFEMRVLEDPAFAEEWGELGPVYGKQWRKWVGTDGKVYDQISNVLQTLKTNPASRRILFHGWNVPEIDRMALPPCHLLYQYHVSSEGRLSCILFQRSADILLGVPFNWTGAVALQLMLAQQAGLGLGEFVWMGGDVHLYKNHVDQAREQLSRSPRPMPTMRLTNDAPESIDGYRIEDFAVEGYDPHPAIQAEVAV
jgi:thymidylate synthase